MYGGTNKTPICQGFSFKAILLIFSLNDDFEVNEECRRLENELEDKDVEPNPQYDEWVRKYKAKKSNEEMNKEKKRKNVVDPV